MADPNLGTTTATSRPTQLFQPYRPTSSPAAAPANGHANGTTTQNTIQNDLPPHLAGIVPSGIHSLSGISLRAHLLGLALGTSSSLALYLIYDSNSLWRAPFFISSLSLFHFLEFYMTAMYNTPLAKIDAFLLSQNGSAYNAAHTLALLETLVVNWFGLYNGILPDWCTGLLIATGLGLMALGQTVRSVAMAHAGTNFNHTVQWRKNKGHELVTSGIYGWLRHPSYFGFFWWALGTQMVLGNLICFMAYAIILWKFFQMRIQSELPEVISSER